MADYFDTNTLNFTISNTEKGYGKFCVQSNNTVDFYMSLTLNNTESVTISLTKDGVVVATAYLSSVIRHRQLIWREKVDIATTFEIRMKRTGTGSTTVPIMKNNYQWAFKVFGPDHVDQIKPPSAQSMQVGGD